MSDQLNSEELSLAWSWPTIKPFHGRIFVKEWNTQLISVLCKKRRLSFSQCLLSLFPLLLLLGNILMNDGIRDILSVGRLLTFLLLLPTPLSFMICAVMQSNLALFFGLEIVLRFINFLSELGPLWLFSFDVVWYLLLGCGKDLLWTNYLPLKGPAFLRQSFVKVGHLAPRVLLAFDVCLLACCGTEFALRDQLGKFAVFVILTIFKDPILLLPHASKSFKEDLLVGLTGTSVRHPEIGRKNCAVDSSSTELKDSETKVAGKRGRDPVREQKQGLGMAILKKPRYRDDKETASFTWKDKGVLSKVANQGMLPICWIYAILGSLEARFRIDHREEVQFSKQLLLDGCCPHEGKAYPYYVDKALKWIENFGLVQELNYPWTGLKGCFNDIIPEFELSGVRKFHGSDENEIKRRLSRHPLPVVIPNTLELSVLQRGDILRVYKEDYELYRRNCNDELVLFHAVILVGWREVNGVPVWEAQNSLGDKYCDDGYFYIVRESGINRDLEYNPLCQVLDVETFGRKQA